MFTLQMPGLRLARASFGSILLGTALATLVPMATAVHARPAASAAAPALAGDLAQVATHLNAVGSMVANFSQTDRRGQLVRGVVLIKRPGKIRFEYQKSVPILIVADGSSLYFIDYSVRQVSRWPIGNSPLTALLEPAKGLQRVAKLVAQPNPDLVVVEARDPKRPEYGTVILNFLRSAASPAGLSLIGWTARDAQGNTTRISLSDVRYNVEISNARFQWRDPRPPSQRNR